MQPAVMWWILAGLAVGAELVTGTFYLLMIALGMAAGALAAHAGAGVALQMVAAAVVGGGAVAAWTAARGRRPAPPAAGRNPDLNLDIGETVQVHAWRADGTATVHYRGAAWTAEALPGQAHAPGVHRVAEVRGNRLVLEKT